MMANFLRPTWNKVVAGLGQVSLAVGLTPNMWTFTGLALSVLAAFFLSRERFWLGLVLAVLMLFADALDGATARAGETTSDFGMILDHVVDRYAEFILFGGILFSHSVQDVSVIFAISGMMMASYVRAKAESVFWGKTCTAGIAGRVEKLLLTYLAIIFLGVGLTQMAEYSLLGIGVISHITAGQRLACARSLMLAE